GQEGYPARPFTRRRENGQIRVRGTLASGAARGNLPRYGEDSAARNLVENRRMSSITLRVNGRAHTVDVEPMTPLLYVLRNDVGVQGPHFGCGLGQCGACTVIINGNAVRSCV